MSRRTALFLVPAIVCVFAGVFAWPSLGADDAAELLERGRELMADRQYDGAARVLGDLAARFPSAARTDEALLLLGKAHLYARRHDQAIATFERLLKNMGGSAWSEKARLLLADAYTASGRHDLAADILQRRLETVEGRAYKVMLADHYLKVAQTAFDGTPSTDPLKRGEKERDLPKAIRYFGKARELLQGEREEAELTVKIARAAFESGNARQAAQELDRFFHRVEDYASPAEVRLLKARAHHALGETAQARSELKDFAAEDGLFRAEPTRPEALALLAETWFKEGGDRAVLRGVGVLAGALRAYPDHPLAETLAFRLGEALHQAGKLDEAVAALHAFRERFPKSARAADAQLAIPEAYFQMKKYDAARAAWRTFIASNPDHSRWAEAQRRIVAALFAAAEDRRETGDVAGAITAYETFLGEYPADALSPRAQETIAHLHEEAEHLNAALEAYRVVATRYAGLDAAAAARSQFRRAELLRLKKEDFDGAMTALEDLLKRFPGAPEAARARQQIAELGARALQVETERVFRLGEEPCLKVSTRNLTKLELRAYPVDLVEYFKNKHDIGRIEAIEVPIIKPVVEWTVETQGYARYKDIERSVGLEKLKALAPKGGAFILAVRGEDLETRTLVLLSDLTLVLKKSPQHALVFVLDEASSQPAAGVEVMLSDGKKIVGSGRTDREGILATSFEDFVPDVRALVYRDGHTAFAGEQSPAAYTFGYRTKVYLYTDRPRYRPGHTVHFKGIARRVEDGAYRIPKDAPVVVRVLDSRGAVLLEEEKKTGAFGTFSGELAIGTDAPLGSYRIHARFDQLEFDASFEVAEYKKPDLLVRVTPARADYLNGERVEATLEAGYFFGGPARGAAITWRAFRTPYAFDATAYQEYAWFFTDPKTPEAAAGGPGEFVTAGQGIADEEGRLKIAFDTGDKEGDWRYAIVTEARGRGRSVAYSSSVLFLTERAYFAVVRADKKAYQPEEDIRVSVTTVNARHEPVARSGQVELIRTAPGETGLTQTVCATAEVTTGADGRGEVKLRAPRGGDYVLRFRGEDRRGGKVVADTGIAVAGEAEDLSRQAKIVAERGIYHAGDRARVLLNTPRAPAWALVTFEGEKVLDHRVIRLERRSSLLELEMKEDYAPNVFLRVAIPADHRLFEGEDEVLVLKFLNVAVAADRTEYRPGETARFTLQATDAKGRPVRGELSLAVVDQSLLEIAPDTGKGIKPFFYDQKRRRSVNTAASLAFRYVARTVKVDPDLLGIEARERLREELEKLEERAKRLMPSSGPAGTVPPNLAPPAGDSKHGAEPAEKLKAEAAVGFARGLELSLGPRRAAGGRRAENKVADRLEHAVLVIEEMTDADAPERAWQGMQADGGVFALLGGDLLDQQLAAVEVRRRFLDTAAFLPHIETDDEGKATVEVALADNLTAWRARAVGVGGEALVGSGDTSIRATKPLVARLDMPRFLTQGDRVRAASVLNNNTKEALALGVELAVEGARLEGAARAPLVLPGYEAERLDWELAAPDPGAVKLALRAAEARPDGARDGMELAIPALPFGEHGRVAHSGTTTESVVFPVKLPEGLLAGACRYGLLLSPGYDAVLLDGLDYLEGFPYGCVEQTVSRFLPAVAAIRALGVLGLDDPARAAQLDARVRAGLARLYHMQHPDGGWGWWHVRRRGVAEHGEADARMTAYALLGLEIARAAGYAVDENVLGRGRHRAADLAQKAPGYDVRAALLHALSINRVVSAADLGAAHRYRDLLSVSGLARLALAHAGLEQMRSAETLVAALKERARREGAHVWWPFADREAGAWDRSPIENTAYAVMALLAVEPDSALVEPAIAYLMEERKGRSFRSTKDTAAVLMALTAYLQQRGLEQADYKLTVEVNGQVAATLVVRKGRVESGARTIALDDKWFRPGENLVKLVKDGPGRMHYAFAADHFRAAETVADAGDLLQVGRAYRPHADPEEQGEDYVKPGWTVVVEKFRPAAETEPDLRELVGGGKTRVELKLTAREPLAYVVLEDPLPAGFEVVEESAAGSFDRFERRDDRVVFFFSKVKDAVQVSYVIQAIHPGDYRARPAFAAPMYEPEIWGRSASAPMKVLDPEDAAGLAKVAREPTADELYYGALKDIAKGRSEAARTKLAALGKWRLKDEILDEVLAHRVRLELEKAPREAVSAYEELLDRNARKAAFDRPVRMRLARAYHGLEEFERAGGFYRQLLDESFERETALVQSYVELGDRARAQEVLLDVLRRYPDANIVVSTFYRRALQYAEIERPDLKREPYLRAAVPTMRLEALQELKAFTTYYPESALADDAQHQIVKLLEDLKNHARAVAEARHFYARYPTSPWLDDVLFLEVQALYAAAEYDAALTAARALAEREFAREDGQPGTAWSPWRDHALYLIGKILHIRGNLKLAVEHYRRVAAQFEDARDAVAFFMRAELEVKPTVAVALDQAPALALTLKNLRVVSGRVYPVDLKVLFAVRKNLANINAIDLTGIPAVGRFEENFEGAPDYVRFEREVKLPIEDKGVFLVVLRGGDRDASTVVVRSDLELKVQRVGRKVRAYVSRRSTGLPVGGAFVRVADGRTIVAEGPTDARGVFEGPNVSGSPSIVVEHEGSFAFYQEGSE
ncbi:MAG: outer membrane protein assembly factor BamD [Planctomycetes bacterium]|nr:outer membrane protein assembly factor BamD [Planctomycetota bacterium]